MKSNYLYIFLLSIFFFSCKRETQMIDVYDGKQSLEFQFNVNPYQTLEGMEVPEAMVPNVYKIFLFKDNLYSNTLTVHDENSMEQLEGGYSYLAVGAEDENMIPALNLVEDESSMSDVFLNLCDEENHVKDIPDIVVSSGSFTMGSTINTVKMDFNPLGCEYLLNCKNLSQHGVKKMKLVVKGGASCYNMNLKAVNDDEVATVMTAAGIDEDGWINIGEGDILCTARILLFDNPSLKLEVSLKDESDQVVVLEDVNIDMEMKEGGAYMADLTLSEDNNNVELEYYSPLYPNVEAVETGNINEHELRLVSRVYSDYKYQWRHESMGRTVLSGFSNGEFKYEENGIAEGPSVIVNGAGKYILSIEKNGVITDVASTIVKHETMTWSQAMAKLQELGDEDWIIPTRAQMAELYNGGVHDFYYDDSTDKAKAECYWTCEEAGWGWAHAYYFSPYWAHSPLDAPVKDLSHAVRFIKVLYNPEDPFSVKMMPSPEPYSGELRLYIKTPAFNGAIYQWSNEKTGRSQLSVDKNGQITYEENGIPEGPEVYVTGAGKYLLSITYEGETRVVGSVTVEHEKLCWSDVQARLTELNQNAEGYEWKVPSSLEHLRQIYNGGNNDCLSGWYWSDEFTNAANQWKHLKDMGNGVEDAGDITGTQYQYYIRFIKQPK